MTPANIRLQLVVSVVWCVLVSLPAQGAEPARGFLVGDDCDWPLFILSLPFKGVGSTAGYSNAFDAYDGNGCPFQGGAAPDVVYSYTPDEDLTVNVSLQTSEYDTKVAVYTDCAGPPVYCDDDACGYPLYQSRLNGVALLAGETYYFVVDGFLGGSGQYTLDITEVEACPEPVAFEQCPPAYGDWWLHRSDAGSGYLVRDNFAGGGVPICGVRWWGAFLDYAQHELCRVNEPRFDITVYDGAGVAVYTMADMEPAMADTGVQHSTSYGLVPVYEFEAGLTPTSDILEAGQEYWIEIVGAADEPVDCHFWWHNTKASGDGVAQRLVDGVSAELSNDLAFCLLGDGLPAVCRGDSNGDGEVTFGDVDYFVAALIAESSWRDMFAAEPPCRFANNDCNADDAVDFDDVDPFVGALATGTCGTGS